MGSPGTTVRSTRSEIRLSSVQRILQRHGGSVRGEGAVGQGATFCFSLPVEPVRQFLDSTPTPG